MAAMDALHRDSYGSKLGPMKPSRDLNRSRGKEALKPFADDVQEE